MSDFKKHCFGLPALARTVKLGYGAKQAGAIERVLPIFLTCTGVVEYPKNKEKQNVPEHTIYS